MSKLDFIKQQRKNKEGADIMNKLDDYFDLKDFEYNCDDDYDNIFELRTLSESEFNKILKTIEETIEKAKKDKQ